MDAIILAAGRGARLDGIAAPFHKPLLVVNGEALITAAADGALDVGARRTIVVVAPENALPISQVLGNRDVHMIVQRKPRGPGDALQLALDLAAPAQRVLVLMGDNYTSYVNLCMLVEGSPKTSNVIGVRSLPARDASRFTWYDAEREWWVEKETPHPDDGDVTAWVGPLLIDHLTLTDALSSQGVILGELPIGPALNSVPDQFLSHVNTIDIGIPDVVATL